MEELMKAARAAGGRGAAAGSGDPAAALAKMSEEQLGELLKQYDQYLGVDGAGGASQLQGAAGGRGGPMLDTVDAEGGVTVRPEPGFVVKVKEGRTGQKAFINLVHSKFVESPHMKTIVPDVGTAGQGAAEPQAGIRVPMSVGPVRPAEDKSGEACAAVDVVVNPEVVDRCFTDGEYKDMLCQLAIGAAAQKHNMQVDGRYKLPNVRYKGGAGNPPGVPELQRLKAKRESQIEEEAAVEALQKQAEESAKVQELSEEELEALIEKEKDDAKKADRERRAALAKRTRKELAEERDIPMFEILYRPATGGDPLAEQFHGKSNGEVTNGFDLDLYEQDQADVAIKRGFKERSSGGSAATAGGNDWPAQIRNKICEVTFSLPRVVRARYFKQQFSLSASREGLQLGFHGTAQHEAAYSPVSVWFPRDFDHHKAMVASWDEERRKLTVRVPVGQR